MGIVIDVQEQKEKNKRTIEKFVYQWGGSASEAVLDNSCEIFTVPEIGGCIGYLVECNCAVVFGDPICAPDEAIPLAKAFTKFCETKGWTVIFVVASARFAKLMKEHKLCTVLLEVGEEFLFDPQVDTIAKHKKLRYKVHHADHVGLKVKEYIPPDEKIQRAIEEVGDGWLKEKEGPQIHLGPLNFFENQTNKRWFYALDGEKVVGASLLLGLKSYNGWLLKYHVVAPKAPIGTSEILVTSILKTLKEEKCPCLTYGMVPGEKLGEIQGLNKVYEKGARALYVILNWFFHLDRRKIYWRKYSPQVQSSFVLVSKKIGLREIRAILKALKIEL